MSLRLASAGRWAAVAALLIASCLSAEAADPFARATVQAPSPIRPGEQVKIDIDVLVPNFFMSPPQFPLFDLPNAVVVLADGATNINETVGGVDFAGIRRSYLVTPQVPGDYALPPAAITFTYAAVPGQPSPGSVPLPPAPFSVEGTQGAAAAAPAAGRVDVSQTVEPDTGKLKVGDALVRTVVVAADDMQAMLIPAPQFSTPEGVRLYRHDPKLVDERSPRGDFVGGRRTDAATYVFERAGTFVLPEVAVGQTLSAPALKVEVAAAATASPLAPPAPEQASAEAGTFDRRRVLALLAAGLLAAAALVVFLRSRVPRWLAGLRSRRAARETSEPACFRRFRQACRREEGAAVYARLDEWARQGRLGPLPDWLRRSSGEAAGRTYEAFMASRFGGRQSAGEAIDYARLEREFVDARRIWLEKAASAGSASALPPLNP